MTATSQRFLSCILHISLLLQRSIWCVSTIVLIHRRSLNKWELKCQWWKPSALISVVIMIQERSYGQDRSVIRSCLYLLSFIGNNMDVSYGVWLAPIGSAEKHGCLPCGIVNFSFFSNIDDLRCWRSLSIWYTEKYEMSIPKKSLLWTVCSF